MDGSKDESERYLAAILQEYVPVMAESAEPELISDIDFMSCEIKMKLTFFFDLVLDYLFDGRHYNK